MSLIDREAISVAKESNLPDEVDLNRVLRLVLLGDSSARGFHIMSELVFLVTCRGHTLCHTEPA
jgi:hypothetical protein